MATTLGLVQPARPEVSALVALCVVPALLGLAAAQPVFATTSEVRTRADAEALFVFDVSRSMLAARSRTGETRLARAKALAATLRSDLAEVPSGIATFQDRTLPHLFPTAGRETFAETLERAVQIGQPPPLTDEPNGVITTLDAIGEIPTHNHFAPSAKRRLVVVFTDGESPPPSDPTLAQLFRRPPGIETIVVHVSRPDEHVYSATGRREVGYVPMPVSLSRTNVERLAHVTGGRAFGERDLAAAAGAARTLTGRGPTILRKHERGEQALAPYVALAAFVPLAFLMRRRNL